MVFGGPSDWTKEMFQQYACGHFFKRTWKIRHPLPTSSVVPKWTPQNKNVSECFENISVSYDVPMIFPMVFPMVFPMDNH